MFHVKHSLEKTLKELNIKKNSEKTDLLLLYLEELMRWNKKINLVSSCNLRPEIWGYPRLDILTYYILLFIYIQIYNKKSRTSSEGALYK